MNAPAPPPETAEPAAAPFDLTRRFSVVALVCVVVVAGALGYVLANLLHEKLLHRDAVVTMEFVQSIVRTDETAHDLLDVDGRALPPALEDSFRHFASMPDVLRANVYSPSRRAVWSSDRELIGRQFGHNEELDATLAGRLVYKTGLVSKEEHVAGAKALPARGVRHFVEIYVPIRDAGGQVVGAVELYKTPQALFDAIAQGQRTILAVSGLGGLLLYAVLIGIVRRADRIMKDQQRRLLEGERLGAVGEMAATVAHAIRNPLSSIRTSVEVALDRDPGNFREPAEDIVGEVDKMEEWVRQLLAFSRPGAIARERFEPNAAVQKALAASAREREKRGVALHAALADPAPAATADPALVEHVLVSLLDNAIDAMPRGGTLRVATRATAKGCEIEVKDDGAGIRAEDLPRVFEPFFTTKSRGTGLGLALSRRIVERMGGTLTLESAAGAGTTVRLHLPA